MVLGMEAKGFVYIREALYHLNCILTLFCFCIYTHTHTLYKHFKYMGLIIVSVFVL